MSGAITRRFAFTHGHSGRAAEMVCHLVRHDGGLELAHRQADRTTADIPECEHTTTQ